MLNLLVLEINELTAITINSIKQNMPDATYTVVSCESNKKINTALTNISEPTLVVSSGLLLNIKSQDIPPLDKIGQYPICCSRAGVYTDHKYKNNYKTINKPMTDKMVDLSIFIINPTLWDSIPDTDQNCLHNKTILYMPRYMNHKTDVQIEDALSAYSCLQYGALGVDAAVCNYTNHLITGEATVNESYAYCFDRFEHYTDGLNNIYKSNIKKLSNKTKRISKFRDSYNTINKEA